MKIKRIPNSDVRRAKVESKQRVTGLDRSIITSEGLKGWLNPSHGTNPNQLTRESLDVFQVIGCVLMSEDEMFAISCRWNRSQ